MADVTIIKTHMVKPAGEATHKGPLYMATWDHIFGVVHVMAVYFYNNHNPPAPEISALKDSLSRALAHFSPFAGRLRRTTNGRLEIDCNSMGAVLVEAECDEEISYLAELPAEKRVVLVAAVDYEKEVHEVPLLLVQLTRLRCGGVAFGLAWAHSVADGESAFHFFHQWARIARGEEPLKEVANLDRRVLRAGRKSQGGRLHPLGFSDHVELSAPPLILGKQNSFEERNKKTVNMVLPLTKAQVDALKKQAADGVSSTIYSRYQVVTAHIWRCTCKARGHKNEQPTTLSFPIDVRNRIHSGPLPPRFFGNAILIMRAIGQAGELLSNPLGFTCDKLREAIDKVDEDYIWSHIEHLEKKGDLSFCSQDMRVLNSNREGVPYYGNPNLGVISWFTLPIYDDMDFGWGDPVDVRPICRDLDGHTVLLPRPNDDGSVVVELCLQADHAHEFKKCFYQDIRN